MSSILSAISGHFSKALILGTFLPVILFVILNLIFVVPVFPNSWPLLRPILDLETQGKVIAISFIGIVITGLLFNLNIPLLRLYEGYPWLDSWVGKFLIRYHQDQFETARSRRLGMRTLLKEMSNKGKDSDTISKLTARRNRIAQRLNNAFPSRKSLIIPTRLGNVIRSFEDYPDRQYGIGAITLWPRLVAKIDKDYAAVIDDSKTSFDFMLNISALSLISALVVTVSGFVYFPPSSLFFPANSGSTRVLTIVWAITILGFSAVSYLAYLGAIERAGVWGMKVKSAFDLYRTELLKQLGYDRSQMTLKEERKLWDAVSLQLIYGDSPQGRDPLNEYKALVTIARSEPPFVDIECARGISRPDDDGAITITVQLRNIDQKNRPGRNVAVIDTMAEGFNYEWGSAMVGNRNPRVIGTNPYRFEVGDLVRGGEVILTYRAIPLKK